MQGIALNTSINYYITGVLLDLNVLNPGKAVASAFEKPNPGMAIGLVLVASLIVFAQGIVAGVPLDVAAFALNVIVPAFLNFFALAIILYVGAFVLKGKGSVSGKFTGVISALGLMQVAMIAFLILSLALIPMILSPEVNALTTQFRSGNISPEVFALEVSNEIEADPFPIYALLGVMGLTALLNLAVFYKIVSKIFGFKPLVNVAVLLVILLILGFLPL